MRSWLHGRVSYLIFNTILYFKACACQHVWPSLQFRSHIYKHEILYKFCPCLNEWVDGRQILKDLDKGSILVRWSWTGGACTRKLFTAVFFHYRNKLECFLLSVSSILVFFFLCVWGGGLGCKSKAVSQPIELILVRGSSLVISCLVCK